MKQALLNELNSLEIAANHPTVVRAKTPIFEHIDRLRDLIQSYDWETNMVRHEKEKSDA